MKHPTVGSCARPIGRSQYMLGPHHKSTTALITICRCTHSLAGRKCVVSTALFPVKERLESALASSCLLTVMEPCPATICEFWAGHRMLLRGPADCDKAGLGSWASPRIETCSICSEKNSVQNIIFSQSHPPLKGSQTHIKIYKITL
jgi:hypothetical protein